MKTSEFIKIPPTGIIGLANPVLNQKLLNIKNKFIYDLQIIKKLKKINENASQILKLKENQKETLNIEITEESEQTILIAINKFIENFEVINYKNEAIGNLNFQDYYVILCFEQSEQIEQQTTILKPLVK